jgi:hypothetical protein
VGAGTRDSGHFANIPDILRLKELHTIKSSWALMILHCVGSRISRWLRSIASSSRWSWRIVVDILEVAALMVLVPTGETSCDVCFAERNSLLEKLME